jgi:hypothetical protein
MQRFGRMSACPIRPVGSAISTIPSVPGRTPVNHGASPRARRRRRPPSPTSPKRLEYPDRAPPCIPRGHAPLRVVSKSSVVSSRATAVIRSSTKAVIRPSYVTRMCAITRTAGAGRSKVVLPSTLPATRSLDGRGRHQALPRRPRPPFTPPVSGHDPFYGVQPDGDVRSLLFNCW